MAAENKILQTTTEVTLSGSNISIYTYFTDSLRYIKAFIKNVVDWVNGVRFVENEEGFVVAGFDDVDFYLNNRGELIVKSNDDKTFTIDSDGYLIFQYDDN